MENWWGKSCCLRTDSNFKCVFQIVFCGKNLSLVFCSSLPPPHPPQRCLSSGTRIFRTPEGFWLCPNTDGFFEITVVKASMQTRNVRKCFWGTYYIDISDFKKYVLNECLFLKPRNNSSLDISLSWSQRLIVWWLYWHLLSAEKWYWWKKCNGQNRTRTMKENTLDEQVLC